MPPANVPVGAEYVPVGPAGPVVVLTGSSGGGAQLAGNASVTFQVAGAAGLPATGLVEVAEHVIVTNPSKGGCTPGFGAVNPTSAWASAAPSCADVPKIPPAARATVIINRGQVR